MKYCSECGAELKSNQKFCSNCGKILNDSNNNHTINKTTTSNMNNKQKKSNGSLGVFLGIILSIGAIYYGIQLSNKEMEEKNIDYSTYVELNPQVLHKDYLDNEISAKDKYVGKKFYFTGTIYGIEEFLGDKYIEIRYTYEKDKSKEIELNAYFDSVNEIKQVKKDEKVTIYCTFKQRSIENYMNVVTSYSLEKCHLK